MLCWHPFGGEKGLWTGEESCVNVARAALGVTFGDNIVSETSTSEETTGIKLPLLSQDSKSSDGYIGESLRDVSSEFVSLGKIGDSVRVIRTEEELACCTDDLHRNHY